MTRGPHPSTRVTSIFSIEDPVVPAAACRLSGAENVEVRGSHSGLAQNAQVFAHLGRVLAGR